MRPIEHSSQVFAVAFASGVLLAFAPLARAAAGRVTFFAGADISALPSMEKAGAVYRDEHGDVGDAMDILHAHGCNLFRVRLFVHPTEKPGDAGGPLQDLNYVIALARRIKAIDTPFLLDIHYSDTWADPTHQNKPAAFAGLSGDALEQRVHDYTAQTLQSLGRQGVMPDWVQVGNEITSGFIWPDGRLNAAQGEAEENQWREMSRLLAAGCRAVREASMPAHPIRIIIHVDGGGRGVPIWFFHKLSATPVDFDVIGISFYPAFKDALDKLKADLPELIDTYHKDVLVAEVGYPWSPLHLRDNPAMIWPESPDGQAQLLRDLTDVCRAQSDHHCIGYCWWFPEAVPIAGQQIYWGGKQGLFDQGGRLLPAASVMALGTNPK